MDSLKKKLIECVVNSKFKVDTVETKEGYKVKVNLSTDLEVHDVIIETVELVKSGASLVIPTIKKCFDERDGVAFVENLPKIITFYTNSKDKREAMQDVIKCIKEDYDESVSKYNATKSSKYAKDANATVKLYNNLKEAMLTKGVSL